LGGSDGDMDAGQDSGSPCELPDAAVDGGDPSCGASGSHLGRCWVDFEVGALSWDSRNEDLSEPFANVNGSGEGVVLTIVPQGEAMRVFVSGGEVDAYAGTGSYRAQHGGSWEGDFYANPKDENGDPVYGTLTIDEVIEGPSNKLVRGSFQGPTLKNEQTRVQATGTYQLPLTQVDQSGSTPQQLLISPGDWDKVCR
jgi:hypothetical protein